MQTEIKTYIYSSISDKFTTYHSASYLKKTFFSNDRVFLFKILKEGKQYSVKTVQQ